MKTLFGLAAFVYVFIAIRVMFIGAIGMAENVGFGKDDEDYLFFKKMFLTACVWPIPLLVRAFGGGRK